MGITLKDRTFENAVRLLDSLQTNKQVTSLIAAGPGANHRAIPEMLDWLRRAGYTPEGFADQLKFIHVAGTKGKGSVCAFVESILLQYRYDAVQRTNQAIGKIGLFTSPHLRTVNERIRIDGAPISEAKFALHFFDLWNRFDLNPPPNAETARTRPGFFRFLTILALHTFVREGVETAIIECGIGGEYDSTNILPAKAVTATAITSLGLDHIGMLGDTVEQIAWHKGGIMKERVAAFSVKQSLSAMAVLKRRAIEKNVELEVVQRVPALEDVRLGLEGYFQKDNAALAVNVAALHLGQLGILQKVLPASRHIDYESLPNNFITGLQHTALAGRCQVLADGNITWFLDGAHTIESIREAAVWFHGHLSLARASSNPPTATMLIFNQTGQRDGAALLRNLLNQLEALSYPPFVTTASFSLRRVNPRLFTYAAFPTNTPFQEPSPATAPDIQAQERLGAIYGDISGNSLYMAYETVEEAVLLAQRVSAEDERVLVFVTGSLHLVGGVLTVLESQAKKGDSMPR